MKGENNVLRGQLRGYLFEIVISELLLRSGFNQIDLHCEPGDRVREIRKGFIELKGRGCWHQIDCPFDYNRPIPFSYPLRILGEVKFYKSPLSKKYIREYIGVMRDIQENYFVSDGTYTRDIYPRKMEIGVYFSANGFQEEAEKLAYAHGIKTISYSNNYIINSIKELIEELEENFLSVKCMKTDAWSEFKDFFICSIQNENRESFFRNYDNYEFRNCFNTNCEDIIHRIFSELLKVQSSFMATTATGVFIHFIGLERFPEELFRETDFRQCHIYYENYNRDNRYFYMSIVGDNRNRKFYFTPPESLDYAAVFGGKIVRNEKERHFNNLNINIELNGISRNLVLQIDRHWLYE